MYYLTVKKNGETIVDRSPFADYETALSETARFYRGKSRRSVLNFTTEVVNGSFIVSYATLRRTQDLNKDEYLYMEKYRAAVKNESAFEYDASYIFSIQSELGIREADVEDVE
jgi:hypothetical protein